MNLVEIKKVADSGSLPVALDACYKWSSMDRFTKLLVKIDDKLFWDSDEWKAMKTRKV